MASSLEKREQMLGSLPRFYQADKDKGEIKDAAEVYRDLLNHGKSLCRDLLTSDLLN